MTIRKGSVRVRGGKGEKSQSTDYPYCGEPFHREETVTVVDPRHPLFGQTFPHISDALPELWNSGQLSNDQKKELLRSLISSVILKRLAPGTIEAKIVWVSGHYSMVYAHSPVYRACDVPGYEEMVQRVHHLWQQEFNDEQIATQLTAEGFRSARSLEVYPSMVQKIRLDRGWKWPPRRRSQLLELEGYVTITCLAQRLGVNRSWVYRRICNRKMGKRSRTEPKNAYKAPGRVWRPARC